MTIQAASIDTAIAKRDVHLRSAEFFNVEKFPQIVFKSRNVSEPARLEAISRGFNNAWRDPAHHSPCPVSGRSAGGHEESRHPLAGYNRADSAKPFGLVFGKTAETGSMIADEVSVEIEIEAQRAK